MATAPADNSRAAFSESELLAGYNKLIGIRDELVGKKFPAIEQVNQSANLANTRLTVDAVSAAGVPSPQVPNGISKTAATTHTPPVQPSSLVVSKDRSNATLSRSPGAQKLLAHTPGSSGIDPIFLTKSTVLVRAEINQKRQRLEKVLEDQVHRSQRQRATEQDALPDFDVTEVLRKAQELVKPIKWLESSGINAVTSSSDSFDENTFYSSQMDESTTTEEADESHKWRPHRICNFYLRGTHCRYGEACTFSHDPVLKQKLDTEASQVVDVDRINADEQASSRQDGTSNKRARKTDAVPRPSNNESAALQPKHQSQGERQRQERIARLEAELRSAKAEQERLPATSLGQHENGKNDSHEESAYSPPGPDEFGRDVGLRDHEGQLAENLAQRRPLVDVQPPRREYIRRDRKALSPLPNDVRVVTNHIRSPVAPQPSRVSPLATAKVPQVSQLQHEDGDNRRLSRASNAGNLSAGQSPKVAPQPRSSRKRRRGRDSGEQTRNVVPRTDFASPVIRVKEEPVSPPPFDVANSGLRQVQLRQQSPRQLYVDTAVTRHDHEHPMFYQPRPGEFPFHGQANDDREPRTPLVRRVISRNGQRYISNEEPDLRRVVTAPRQVRAPMSPAPYPVQYSAPQPRATRASQVYLSPTGQTVPYQNRALAQNQGPPYIAHERSPSPPIHRIPQSPVARHPTTMAPPPRRIVIDQWGNRFMEAPMPIERHASVVPSARTSEFDPRYEELVPRSASVMRQPKMIRVDDEGQYVRRAPSPTSDRIHEVPTRTTIDPRGDSYEQGPYIPRNVGPPTAEYTNVRPMARYEELPEQDARIIRMQSVRPIKNRNEEGAYSDERIIRMQSVRPTGDAYEAPREQLMRIQSVRPEQPRIIKLGERQEPGRQVSRQVSVHPNDGELRQVDYALGERPRYQQAPPIQQRGYAEDADEEGGLHNASSAGGRMLIQRM